MKYLILILALTLGAVAHAETLEELKARIDARPNVIGVGEDVGSRGTYMPGVNWGESGELLYKATIVWLVDNGETVQKNSKDVLIFKMGVIGEEVVLGWIGSDVPEPIRVVPDAYITGRTSAASVVPKRPFTAAEVETFCNLQYKALPNQSAARDAIGFTVENVTPNTIRVSGYFHDASITAVPTRVKLTYLITLVDANGATTGANVKFEKVIE